MWAAKQEAELQMGASVSQVAQHRLTGLYTDHYELTMVASALTSGLAQRQSVFEVFARRIPAGRSYGVVAGINRLIDAVERFRFDQEALDFIEKTGLFEHTGMREWVRDYRFSGNITGYPDGELFFPYSPILTVEGTYADCVVLETVILSILNHDCAIAGAAARVTDAANGKTLIDGGSRRTDPDAAVAAARAAHIGGFDTTSNLEAGRRYGIPTGGTTAHAFMLAYDTETQAFAAQRDALGTGSTFLVDTFDIEEGIRNAVKVVGTGIGAVRIDSGNLAVESVKARALLDSLGATETKIIVSGDLDEFRVHELEKAETPIDGYLVGTSLVTGSGHPTASMVYKLVSIATSDSPDAPLRAVGKLSPGKRTIGGRKEVDRTIDADGNWAEEILTIDPAQGVDAYKPQRLLIQDGRSAFRAELGQARKRCAASRSKLRPSMKSPYPESTPAIPTTWVGIEIDADLKPSVETLHTKPNGARELALSSAMEGTPHKAPKRGGSGANKSGRWNDPKPGNSRKEMTRNHGESQDKTTNQTPERDAEQAPGRDAEQAPGRDAVRRALLIVDVQNDFCEGGSLAVTGGTELAKELTELLEANKASGYYQVIAATQDWHIEPGEHFQTWPVHCKVGTPGADFHENLKLPDDIAVFQKGEYEAAYSGFEAKHRDTSQSLAQWLKEQHVTHIDVVGLATDYCVKASALDAVEAGFITEVKLDLCRAIAAETLSSSLDEMKRAGVAFS